MQTRKLPKFFIVDDDPFCRFRYNQHLINLGFHDNVLFDNGLDCINKLNLQPDIIFLDYDMQPYNGLEMIEKINRLNPDIYLLLISGQKDMQVAINALKSGAHDYVIKGENDIDRISSILQKMFVKTKKLTRLCEVN
jgi:DNA-binding NtrC family response regulator